MPLLAPRFKKSDRLQKASTNSPSLRRGETSQGVTDLQRALLDLGFEMPISTKNASKPPDGIFGAETEAALKKLQASQSLTADGVAGHDTLARLDAIFLENDPFFADPDVERVALFAAMSGPPNLRPFAVTTERKRDFRS